MLSQNQRFYQFSIFLSHSLYSAAACQESELKEMVGY